MEMVAVEKVDKKIMWPRLKRKIANVEDMGTIFHKFEKGFSWSAKPSKKHKAGQFAGKAFD